MARREKECTIRVHRKWTKEHKRQILSHVVRAYRIVPVDKEPSQPRVRDAFKSDFRSDLGDF